MDLLFCCCSVEVGLGFLSGSRGCFEDRVGGLSAFDGFTPCVL